MMNILRKIQDQPERIRKFIFWVVFIVLGLALLFWWAKSIPGRTVNFQGGKFIEGLEMPKINKEALENYGK